MNLLWFYFLTTYRQKRNDLYATFYVQIGIKGIGKPESLKYNFTGYWSRRITREHRIIYKVGTNTIYVIQLRGHY